MRRRIIGAGTVALLFASVATASAQVGMYGGPYFEVTPMVGYMWGGSLDTDAFATVPAGELRLGSSVGYGLELGYSPNGAGWVELTYMRQSTEVTFQPRGSSNETVLGDFATNYIHLGGRYEFGKKVRPFVGAGAGIVVYDPKGDYGTNTQFSMSVEGGVKAMFGKAQRIGVRGTVRGWFGWVPNGTYGAWCDYWGFCYVTEGTATVSQGEVSGGIVFQF